VSGFAGARRLVAALLPRAWRDRYGQEALDLVGGDGRPLADLLDLARLAVELHITRTEAAMRRTLVILSAVMAALGAVGLAWSTPRLTGGIAEVPGHWWSTLAVSPLPLAAVLAVLAWRTGARRRARPSR
jgi:hypothetical protein